MNNNKIEPLALDGVVKSVGEVNSRVAVSELIVLIKISSTDRPLASGALVRH